jgi:hypothetical protein
LSIGKREPKRNNPAAVWTLALRFKRVIANDCGADEPNLGSSALNLEKRAALIA